MLHEAASNGVLTLFEALEARALLLRKRRYDKQNPKISDFTCSTYFFRRAVINGSNITRCFCSCFADFTKENCRNLAVLPRRFENIRSVRA